MSRCLSYAISLKPTKKELMQQKVKYSVVPHVPKMKFQYMAAKIPLSKGLPQSMRGCTSKEPIKGVSQKLCWQF